MSALVRTLAASAVVLAAASVAADVSTAAATSGERRALSIRDAIRCWPRRHFKALDTRDRAHVEAALAREANRLGSSAVANALLQFERWYVQERNGRIHVYAEPARIYQHPEDLETERRCPNFFGNDIPDDSAFWRATYDPRTDTFVELNLANFDAHL